MKVSREFKVGLTAIVALVLLYWGFNFLKGKNLFSDEKVFYAVYSKVDGLTAARPVLINGFKVGQVKDVYFHPDNSGRLMVAMNITSDFRISENSIASIHSTDLLGEKSIELLLGDSPEPAKNGDTLASNIKLTLTEEVNQQVAPLKSKAEKLFASMDTVLTLVSGFLNEDTKDNFLETFNSVRRSFQKLEHTVTTVDETVTATQDDLETTIGNIAKITTNLEENSENLSRIFENVNAISDSLSRVRFAETFTSLTNALQSAEEVMRKIDQGEGSLGKLINDDQLYHNLEDASRQLDLLLLDIKYNPKRYLNFSVFGKDREYDEEEIRKQEKKLEEKREAAKVR